MKTLVLVLFLIWYLYRIIQNKRFIKKVDSILGKDLVLESEISGKKRYFISQIEHSPLDKYGDIVWWWPWIHARLTLEDGGNRILYGKRSYRSGKYTYCLNVKSYLSWTENLKELSKTIDEMRSDLDKPIDPNVITQYKG